MPVCNGRRRVAPFSPLYWMPTNPSGVVRWYGDAAVAGLALLAAGGAVAAQDACASKPVRL